MHVTDPHIWRGGAYVFIALFSCLQILFGFFLITEDGQKKPVPVVKMALYSEEINGTPETANFDVATNVEPDALLAQQLNNIMPTAGKTITESTTQARLTTATNTSTSRPKSIPVPQAQDQDESFHEIAKKLSTLNSTTPQTPQYRPPLQAR